jgi:hypothetical protein
LDDQGTIWHVTVITVKLQEILEGYFVNWIEVKPHDRTVNGKEHTITWHIDDLKSIDMDSKVNDQFWEWIKKIYTSDKNGEVKILCGN